MNARHENLVVIGVDESIRHVMGLIDRNGMKLAVFVDVEGTFLGVVSDGDIRRALLDGKNIESKIDPVINRKALHLVEGRGWSEVIAIANSKGIAALPIVDRDDKFVDILNISGIQSGKVYSNPVVLMAGGLGTRLRPITENIPKPMVYVGGQPILKYIIDAFIKNGFADFRLCVSYKAEVIESYFGNGKEFGAKISYTREEKRMGTAGALSLLRGYLNEPFFVMNADLITSMSFSAMMESHKNCKAMVTVGVRKYSDQIPYGVIDRGPDGSVRCITEKPIYDYLVSAGIYVVEPEVFQFIRDDEPLDMPTLIEKLIDIKMRVNSYEIDGYWLDIGRSVDLEQAQQDIHKFSE